MALPRGHGQPKMLTLPPHYLGSIYVGRQSMSPISLQDGLGGLLRLFWLQEGSKSSPRGFQEPFLTPLKGDTISGPMLERFGPPKAPPGNSKIKEILCTVFKFCGFVVFGSGRLWRSILDPLGLHFGSLLAPKMAESCLKNPLKTAPGPS